MSSGRLVALSLFVLSLLVSDCCRRLVVATILVDGFPLARPVVLSQFVLRQSLIDDCFPIAQLRSHSLCSHSLVGVYCQRFVVGDNL